jgi:hypothetical protein
LNSMDEEASFGEIERNGEKIKEKNKNIDENG